MVDLPKNKQLILFDGVCHLCNGAVQYILKNDKKDVFLFTPLQSDTGKQVIEDYQIDTTKVDSILLLNPKKKLLYKSGAVLRIAFHLKFPINVLSVFLVIPPSIRNWVYDQIAKNRYKWNGKRETCMMPSPEIRKKFLM